MNTEKLNNWLTLLANLGVLIGIIILSLEIRQSNRISISSNEIAIRNNYSSVNDLILSDPILADMIRKTYFSNEELNNVEMYQYQHWVYRLTNNWEAVERAYLIGMIGEGSYNMVFDDITAAVPQRPDIQAIWTTVLDRYPRQQQLETRIAIRKILDE